MVTAAAIYARISSDPTGEQLGVKRQVDDCRAFASQRGWPVAEVYIDDDRSAYSGKPRPEYRRMLADLEAGTIDAMIVWRLDRLHRQPRELEEFLDLCDRMRVTDLATVTGNVDLSTDTGRLHARIMGAVSRAESDAKSARLKRKHLELAANGSWKGGGSRPFGYMPDRVSVNEAEAESVKEAAKRILAGDSLRAVAIDFTDRGVRTVGGNAWAISSLRRLLLSARIAGLREHHGRVVGPAIWPAIITPDESARLRTLLTDPARRMNRSPRRYLLSGLLRCGLCGARMVARPRENGDPRYACVRDPRTHGCGRIAVAAPPIERLIEEAVLYRLDTPTLARAVRRAAEEGGGSPDAADGIEADRQQLEELATAYGNRLVTFAEYLAARKPIEARIEAARRAIARTTRAAAIADYVDDPAGLRERWPHLPLSRQRAIVAALLDRALVMPVKVMGRNVFDPDRVEPVWRV